MGKRRFAPGEMDSTKYRWVHVERLAILFSLTQGRTIVDHVTLRRYDDVPEANDFYGRGSVNYVNEAFLLDDGTIIASCSASSFTDTYNDPSTKTLLFQLIPL